MFGDKCKVHGDVELQREYPSEGNGVYVEFCPQCRKESPVRKFFEQVRAELDTEEQKFTAYNRPIMPLSCEGCTLKETVHCQTCVRNATTDWYTTA